MTPERWAEIKRNRENYKRSAAYAVSKGQDDKDFDDALAEVERLQAKLVITQRQRDAAREGRASLEANDRLRTH